MPTFEAPSLNRADRRAIGLHKAQPPGDLVLTRTADFVFVGIRHGGRVRLTLTEARQLAGSLLNASDADPS